MLHKLSVKNYAIIQDLEMKLDHGLIILTGETGSGKSILLGAMGLIMGDRADTKVVFDPESKCIVEATFDVSNYDLTSFFEENDLDYEDLTIIRREINPNGKTRAFVNDSPVNLNILKDLSDQLVDLHQQFDTLSISNESFQINVVDAMAKTNDLLQEYRKLYKERQTKLSQLSKWKEIQNQASKEQEFIQFQLDEILAADLVLDEQEKLEEEIKILGSAEDIKKQAGFCFNLLSDSEFAASQQLEQSLHALAPLMDIHPGINSLYERIDSIHIELEDIIREMENVFEQTEHDPERLQECELRLDLIYKLQKKHQVDDLPALLKIQEQFEQQLLEYNDISGRIADLEKTIKKEEDILKKLGTSLNKQRLAAFPIIQDKVHRLLEKVNMQHAKLKVEAIPLDTFGPNGMEKIQFLFAANKGSRFQPIREVASGGEMSRLALCIKSIVGNALALPTMIFDEIDTGVSGQVALQMSAILKELSEQHQVIVITHTPQVAARASQHFVVFKDVQPDRTYTRIKNLDVADRVHNIAVMLSTDPPTHAALQNAQELISL